MKLVHITFVLKVFAYSVLSFKLFTVDSRFAKIPFSYFDNILGSIIFGIVNIEVFGVLFFVKQFREWLQKNVFTVIVIECFFLCVVARDIYATVICLMVLLLISRIPNVFIMTRSGVVSVPAMDLWVGIAFSVLYMYIMGFMAYTRTPEYMGNGYSFYAYNHELKRKLPQLISNAAHDERYIILKEWLTTENYRNDRLKYPLGPGNFYYYIIDKKGNTVAVPMTEARFRISCREKGINLHFPQRDRGGKILEINDN